MLCGRNGAGFVEFFETAAPGTGIELRHGYESFAEQGGLPKSLRARAGGRGLSGGRLVSFLRARSAGTHYSGTPCVRKHGAGICFCGERKIAG